MRYRGSGSDPVAIKVWVRVPVAVLPAVKLHSAGVSVNLHPESYESHSS
jgi:hypothetical protein